MSPKTVLSDTIRTVDLRGALRLFEANNLSLRRIQADVRAARSQIRSARAYPNPRLQVTHEPLQRGNQSFSETYVNLSQTVPWSGRSGRIDAARRHANATALRGRADSARLALEVATTYLAAAADEQRRDHLRRVARVFRQADSSFVQRRKVGEASGYAARRVHVERIRYEQHFAAATVEARDTQQRLALHILPNDASAVSPLGLPDGTPPQISETDAVRTALRQRPELRRWIKEVEARRATAQAARRAVWPDPTITAGYKRQSDDFDGAFIGLSVPIPVFDRNRGAVGVETAQIEAAQTQQEMVRREIRNDVRSAAAAYRAARQQWQIVGAGRMTGTEDLLRIARTSYAEGEMSLLELLDAADAYRDARLRHLQLRQQLWARYFRLRHAMGLSIVAVTE